MTEAENVNEKPEKMEEPKPSEFWYEVQRLAAQSATDVEEHEKLINNRKTRIVTFARKGITSLSKLVEEKTGADLKEVLDEVEQDLDQLIGPSIEEELEVEKTGWKERAIGMIK